jgi:hypothetical protein
MVVITKGLDGNESVVQTGQMMLNPGVPVTVQNAPPSAAAAPAHASGAAS